MALRVWFMPDDPDAPMYQLGAKPVWTRDDAGRWRPDCGDSPAAMLRGIWDGLHTRSPELASVEQIMRAVGVPIPKRSEAPVRIAERIRAGDKRADAVRLVARELCMSEAAVRRALSEEAKHPRPAIAQEIWVGDVDGNPVLVYDIAHDDRYPRDQRKDR